MDSGDTYAYLVAGVLVAAALLILFAGIRAARDEEGRG